MLNFELKLVLLGAFGALAVKLNSWFLSASPRFRFFCLLISDFAKENALRNEFRRASLLQRHAGLAPVERPSVAG
jgi:hypothetical protein